MPPIPRPAQKPNWLSELYARQYEDDTVVSAYQYRAPYPPQTIDILMDLAVARPQAALDAGCGTGAIARPLAQRMARVDAVDFSAEMLKAGRAAPGGDAPNIRWVLGSAETAPLEPPYALIVAASSLQWMDWNIVMPRFADALAPGAVLAIVQPTNKNAPDLRSIIPRYSTNQEYVPYDWLAELEQSGLFHRLGTRQTPFMKFTQTIQEFIESYHSMNGFSRRRMTPQAAMEFDQEATRLVKAQVPSGSVTFEVAADVLWGMPSGI